MTVCVYCEKERRCPFTVDFHKANYPICEECVDEAAKDSFIVWFKPER